MTPEALHSQFLSVASALGAKPGSPDYFYSQVDGTPFLMKLLSDDPPAYMIKMRMTGPCNRLTAWSGSLPELYADADVGCEIEGNYMFLWIRDASVLGAEEIGALVRNCVDYHSSYFPDSSGYCFDCREAGEVSVVQSDASVTSICENCLSKRSEAQKKEEVRLNSSSGALAFLIPLAVALSALGWAFFWGGITPHLLPSTLSEF